MPDRASEDFSGVITNLIFDNEDINPVSKALTNHAGVYCNLEAPPDFQYAAAFKVVIDGTVWVEVWGVELLGSTLYVTGRYSSNPLAAGTSDDDAILQASQMVDDYLS